MGEGCGVFVAGFLSADWQVGDDEALRDGDVMFLPVTAMALVAINPTTDPYQKPPGHTD